MSRLLVSFISGLLFGVGLLISGMTDTAKVQGWLDILGQWDPTLAFVMGGAIIPMTAAWAIAARKAPLFDYSFSMPSNKTIDFKSNYNQSYWGCNLFKWRSRSTSTTEQ